MPNELYRATVDRHAKAYAEFMDSLIRSFLPEPLKSASIEEQSRWVAASVFLTTSNYSPFTVVWVEGEAVGQIATHICTDLTSGMRIEYEFVPTDDYSENRNVTQSDSA